ncbi:MAG TPA: hypothetical protein VF170_13555 [Planctomycetaceae bacterium]
MTLSRIFPFAILVLAASVASGQERVPGARPGKAAPERVDIDRKAAAPEKEVTPEERERAREAFIAARQDFTEMLATALTSAELAEEAREISASVRLRRAEDRLGEVRERLEDAEEAGRGETDEARRLRERAGALEVEVDVLRRPETARDEGEAARQTAQAIAARFRTAMAEETEYLADVLDVGELRERTRRLRRLTTVARLVGGGVQALRQERAGDEEAGKVVPAGGTAEPRREPGRSETRRGDAAEAGTADDGSLGEGTTAPPTLEENAETPRSPETEDRTESEDPSARHD